MTELARTNFAIFESAMAIEFRVVLSTEITQSQYIESLVEAAARKILKSGEHNSPAGVRVKAGV